MFFQLSCSKNHSLSSPFSKNKLVLKEDCVIYPNFSDSSIVADYQMYKYDSNKLTGELLPTRSIN